MEDYLKGDLSQESLKVFNDKLQNEPEFETEFRVMKSIQEGAKTSAKLSVLTRLEKVEASIQEKETTKIEFSMKKLVSVAASLILIATVSYFTVFNTPNMATGQEVFDEYFEHYQNLETARERGEEVDLTSLKSQAYFSYDSYDYKQSALLFSELLSNDKSAANFFYSGIANAKSGNFEEAKANFNTVLNNYEDYEAMSTWSLAMSLFGENTEESTEQGIYSMVSLALGSSSYKESALEVLDKMGVSIATDGDVGEIEDETRIPNCPSCGPGNSPDGSIETRRQIQFGVLSDQRGNKYRFFNDRPIQDLNEGDMVEFISITRKRAKRKRSMGWAFILENYN